MSTFVGAVDDSRASASSRVDDNVGAIAIGAVEIGAIVIEAVDVGADAALSCVFFFSSAGVFISSLSNVAPNACQSGCRRQGVRKRGERGSVCVRKESV